MLCTDFLWENLFWSILKKNAEKKNIYDYSSVKHLFLTMSFIFVCCFSWQACICGYPIATGAATRLVSGYDSYGNTCGQNNTKIDEVTFSGRDMRQNKWV